MNKTVFVPTPMKTPVTPRPDSGPNFSSNFASRLSMPQTEQAVDASPENAAETARLAAFKQLVSSACYLSYRSGADLEGTLEAVQILHDCSQELLREGLAFGKDPLEMEDRIWNEKQYKWQQGVASATTTNTPLPIRAITSPAQGQVYNTGANPFCAHCNDYTLLRTDRRGFLATHVYPRFGLFPWECAGCRRVTFRKQRYRADTKEAIETTHLPWEPTETRSYASNRETRPLRRA